LFSEAVKKKLFLRSKNKKRFSKMIAFEKPLSLTLTSFISPFEAVGFRCKKVLEELN